MKRSRLRQAINATVRSSLTATALLGFVGAAAHSQPVAPATGLIVDVRGLGFSPCMFPRLVVEGGKEVWGTYIVTSQYANDVGVASFVRDLDAARALKARGGPDQLVVRAVRVAHPCDASLGDADAQRVSAENARSRFFEGFRVTFVY